MFIDDWLCLRLCQRNVCVNRIEECLRKKTFWKGIQTYFFPCFKSSCLVMFFMIVALKLAIHVNRKILKSVFLSIVLNLVPIKDLFCDIYKHGFITEASHKRKWIKATKFEIIYLILRKKKNFTLSKKSYCSKRINEKHLHYRFWCIKQLSVMINQLCL